MKTHHQVQTQLLKLRNVVCYSKDEKQIAKARREMGVCVRVLPYLATNPREFFLKRQLVLCIKKEKEYAFLLEELRKEYPSQMDKKEKKAFNKAKRQLSDEYNISIIRQQIRNLKYILE